MRRSTWRADLAAPLLLAVSEAGWGSLLLRSWAADGRHVHLSLPYLAVLLPLAAAVAGVGAARRVLPAGRGRSARVLRRTALAALVVIGLMLSAGTISSLSVGGSWLVAATHPWASVGHEATVVARTAWVVAVLTWLRGTWLVSVELSARQVVLSGVGAAVTFLAVFISHAASPHSQFAATTGGAGALFFVTFPAAGAAVALVRQQELEEIVLQRRGSGPGGVWLTTLLVPMLVVSAVGLAVATIGGPVARFAGRLAADIVRLAARALAALFSLLPGINIHVKPAPPHGLPAGVPGHLKNVHPGHTPGWLLAVAIAVSAVVVAGLVYLIVRLVLRYLADHRPQPGVAAEDEERDSVFSWSHLLAQLRGALRRLVPRRRRRAGTPSGVGRAAAGAGGPDAEGGASAGPLDVRAAYRRLLVESRRLGLGRRPPETPLELETRFAAVLSSRVVDHAGGDVDALTDVYNGVRYGAAVTGDAEARAATARVERILSDLSVALAPPEQPEAPPPATPAASGRSRSSAAGGRGEAAGRRWWRRRRSR
ncbi:MAG TPA: DUF4129 domain-containing protein [Acidimicrobiales bacterium]|nr:DUF4129 domain-containing protein [Acidimicrobiales bacterium]